MIYDHANKKLHVKIVYYGPGMSGKTTSVKYMFRHLGKEDTLQSIESTIGRTLFFDFGVLEFQGTEWGLKFLIYSATGQDFYAETRPSTLQGVDGIVFVVDSRLECLKHNIRSWNELTSMFKADIYNKPIMISLNKYDLANGNKITEEGFLNYINSKMYNCLSINRTVAIKGEGVIEAFNRLIKFIFPQLIFNLV